VTIPQTSLEEVVSIVGPDDEQLFLEFVRKMLQWLPEQRKQPSELLKDPWLTRETRRSVEQ
jgi:serine/threonine-protein kinase SRPK3